MSLDTLFGRFFIFTMSNAVCTGNHPYETERYVVYDYAAVKELTEVYFIINKEDFPAFLDMVKQSVKQQHLLTDAKNDKDFNDRIIKLAKNFELTENGILCAASPGDISYYAAGSIEVEIPYFRLQGFFRPMYENVFSGK